MTFAECIEADVAMLKAVADEQKAIAALVREAHLEWDGHKDEWVSSGLDRELLDKLADKILARVRITVEATDEV